jgi:YVTN family beta-propeller protein
MPVLGEESAPIKIRRVGKVPNFIALSPDGAKIYATSYATDELIVVDLKQKVVAQRISIGSAPLGLAIAEGGKTALVACRDAGTVTMIDLATFRVIADVKTGNKPNTIAIDPRGYRAYVVDSGRSQNGALHILDLRERNVVASIKLGVSPFGLAVSPASELVFVLMGGSNEVWVVDPNKQRVINKIPVGDGPDGIAITPDGKRVFVANSRTNDLSVIDAQLMRVLITVPIGKMPFGIAVSPDGKRVFVVNTGSHTVSILSADLSDLNNQLVSVEKGSTDIEVASDNRTLYVISEETNALSVIDAP